MNANSLNIVLNPSTGERVYPGSSTELSVIATNQGEQGMIVEVYLDLPASLKSWCKVSRESFNLATGQSQVVNFQWQVPEQAIPYNYRYDVVIDSPVFSAPLRYTLTLEILTPLQKAARSIDPTFGITPLTSSTNPLKLESSQPLTIQIIVHNRSNRVDEFRLSCPDLDEIWYKIRYPEGLGQLGVVTESNKLSLNPAAKGQITFILQPPIDALSGTYSPTLDLASTVNPNLSLQEIFYFHLPPHHQLQVQLQAIRDQINKTVGLYEIQLENQGNTIRKVKPQIETAEEQESCEYVLEPPQVKIAPGKKEIIKVSITPVQKLQQPFWGTAKSFRFRVNIEDLDNAPLPSQLPLQGTLYWKHRPLWQLLLLLLLGILGIGSLIFLIWLVLRGPSNPEIVSFESAESEYPFGENIRLNWKIANPQKLNYLTIIAKDSKGKEAINPITIKSDELPTQCVKDEKYLTCQNFPTGAQQPGEYIFNLSLFTENEKPVNEKVTSLISLKTAPYPKISNLGFSQNKYWLSDPVDLSFGISNYSQVKAIEIYQNNIKKDTLTLSKLPSICQSANNNFSCKTILKPGKPGNYTYSLKVVPKYPSQYYSEDFVNVDAKNSVLVEEKPIDLKIELFSINDKTTSPISISVSQDAIIKWKVTGKNVNVSITGMGVDLPSQGLIKQRVEDLKQYQGQPFNLTLTATDANKQTKTSELFGKYNTLPSPSPSPQISPTPQPTLPSP